MYPRNGSGGAFYWFRAPEYIGFDLDLISPGKYI